MDLVTDQIKNLVAAFDSPKGNILVVHGAKSLFGSIQTLIESSSKLSSASSSIVGDFENQMMTKAAGNGKKAKETSHQSNDKLEKVAAESKGRVTLKIIQNAGFYPMIDSPDTMLDVLGTWYSDLSQTQPDQSDL